MHQGFDALTFDNRFLRELPGDPRLVNVPRQVHGACYSLVEPTGVAGPRLLAHSQEISDTRLDGIVLLSDLRVGCLQICLFDF